MADELRGSMDSGEYKHVVLGLIFLKYISDRFEQRHVQLTHEVSDPDNDNFIAEPDERRFAKGRCVRQHFPRILMEGRKQ